MLIANESIILKLQLYKIFGFLSGIFVLNTGMATWIANFNFITLQKFSKPLSNFAP